MGLMLLMSGKICVGMSCGFYPSLGLCVVLVHTDQCVAGAVAFISGFFLQILESAALCLGAEKELVEVTILTLLFSPGGFFLTLPSVGPRSWINPPVM